MGRNSEGQRGLENSRSMIDCSPIQIPKIDGKTVHSVTHIATGSFMTCIAAKIGSDPEKEPEEQVVLFTGTSFLPHGSKPSSAKPRLTSERSLRLDIATLEAAIQVILSFPSIVTEPLRTQNLTSVKPRQITRVQFRKKTWISSKMRVKNFGHRRIEKRSDEICTMEKYTWTKKSKFKQSVSVILTRRFLLHSE